MARPEGLFGALRLTPAGPPSLRDDVVSRLRRSARTSDRLVRSFNYASYITVNISLIAVTPVAFCSTVHNRAGLNPAKVRQRILAVFLEINNP